MCGWLINYSFLGNTYQSATFVSVIVSHVIYAFSVNLQIKTEWKELRQRKTDFIGALQKILEQQSRIHKRKGFLSYL